MQKGYASGNGRDVTLPTESAVRQSTPTRVPNVAVWEAAEKQTGQSQAHPAFEQSFFNSEAKNNVPEQSIFDANSYKQAPEQGIFNSAGEPVTFEQQNYGQSIDTKENTGGAAIQPEVNSAAASGETLRMVGDALAIPDPVFLTQTDSASVSQAPLSTPAFDDETGGASEKSLNKLTNSALDKLAAAKAKSGGDPRKFSLEIAKARREQIESAKGVKS